jgi:hypothetical protein
MFAMTHRDQFFARHWRIPICTIKGPEFSAHINLMRESLKRLNKDYARNLHSIGNVVFSPICFGGILVVWGGGDDVPDGAI